MTSPFNESLKATAKRLEADLKDAIYNINVVLFAKDEPTERQHLRIIGETVEKMSKDIQAALRGF